MRSDGEAERNAGEWLPRRGDTGLDSDEEDRDDGDCCRDRGDDIDRYNDSCVDDDGPNAASHMAAGLPPVSGDSRRPYTTWGTLVVASGRLLTSEGIGCPEVMGEAGVLLLL